MTSAIYTSMQRTTTLQLMDTQQLIALLRINFVFPCIVSIFVIIISKYLARIFCHFQFVIHNSMLNVKSFHIMVLNILFISLLCSECALAEKFNFTYIFV